MSRRYNISGTDNLSVPECYSAVLMRISQMRGGRMFPVATVTVLPIELCDISIFPPSIWQAEIFPVSAEHHALPFLE